MQRGRARSLVGMLLGLALGSVVLVSASRAQQTASPGRAPAERAAVEPDAPSAPVDFALEETSGRTRTLAEVRGRVVIVFYEGREHAELNRDFKQTLHRFLEDNALRGETTTYAVADLTSVGEGVVRDLVRTVVRAAASQHGIQLLLDWEGAVLRAPLSMRAGEANVALLDRQGRVRFRHAGAVGETERRAFFRTLRALLREPRPGAESPEPPPRAE